MHTLLTVILDADSPVASREALGEALETLDGKADRAIDKLERGFEDATAILTLAEDVTAPSSHYNVFALQIASSASSRKSGAVRQSSRSFQTSVRPGGLVVKPSYASFNCTPATQIDLSRPSYCRPGL